MCMKKKLLLLPIIFFLTACQPSELERCVEANKSKIDINKYLLNSEYPVVSNEELKQQWIKDYESHTSLELGDEPRNYLEDVELIDSIGIYPETGIPFFYKTIGELSEGIQALLKTEDHTYNVFNFQRHLDYNIEYYGISEEILNEAEAICNSQGVY